jgi:hypothetical protein
MLFCLSGIRKGMLKNRQGIKNKIEEYRKTYQENSNTVFFRLKAFQYVFKIFNIKAII